MLKPAQIVLLSGASVLALALWFGDRRGPDHAPDAAVTQTKVSETIEWESVLDTAFAELQRKDPSSKMAISRFQNNPASGSSDSLLVLLRSLQKGPASAYLLEKKAKATQEAGDWFISGQEYYRSIGQVKENFRMALYQKAILCFGKANEIQPRMPETLTALGTCYVEGSNNPMEGITFLREAITLDSTYIPAHLQLGVFAMQSGQWDRAESRMNKVLTIDPNASIAWLYLGEIYKQLKKKDKALEALQTYRNRLSDPLLREEVDGYIQQLKNS